MVFGSWEGHTRQGIEHKLVDSDVEITSARYKINLPNFGGVPSIPLLHSTHPQVVVFFSITGVYTTFSDV